VAPMRDADQAKAMLALMNTEFRFKYREGAFVYKKFKVT
jgi:hypothetical protein